MNTIKAGTRYKKAPSSLADVSLITMGLMLILNCVVDGQGLTNTIYTEDKPSIAHRGDEAYR
ncbi:hypothetical protein FEI15_08695 [Lacticaseibacillus zeae]|uniref:Uncharacterized protein n=1 Tax=Lacticaseibacillus zeae TaxID=57037 RepID=A0A5R8LPQ0_LACZE|nr:hypothetical protein [Lacticaseibacillus zeae]TLF39100.1 hypothetical protein FEI15_08695 [Lacticaseibacillus zeae]